MATITRDTTISYRGQVLRLAKGQKVGAELGRYLDETDGPVELTDDERKQARRIAKERKKAAKEAEKKAAEEASGDDEPSGDDDNGDGDGQGSDPADDAPPGNASREDWATYADKLGIDVDGLGRDEIKAAVEAAQKGS